MLRNSPTGSTSSAKLWNSRLKKKKTTVHIAYERIFSFASSLERNYNIDKNDTERLLFSPLFPSIDLSNDELALLEFTDGEYAADAVRIQTLIM